MRRPGIAFWGFKTLLLCLGFGVEPRSVKSGTMVGCSRRCLLCFFGLNEVFCPPTLVPNRQHMGGKTGNRTTQGPCQMPLHSGRIDPVSGRQAVARSREARAFTALASETRGKKSRHPSTTGKHPASLSKTRPPATLSREVQLRNALQRSLNESNNTLSIALLAK